MKKRKNIILSAITCFVSICLLMLGVYSASNPGVSISGQVSYTARDASVLVQGKTSRDGSALVFDTVPSTKNFDSLTEKTSGESYLDWTDGEGHDVAGDQLKAWAVGDLNFVEGADGVKPIKLGFSFTNYSNFPVEATIVLNTSTLTSTTNVEIVVQTSDEIDENSKLTKTIILAKGETKSCEFVYKVIDDSKDASGAKIDVKVDFANANKMVTPKYNLEIVGISNVDSYFPNWQYEYKANDVGMKMADFPGSDDSDKTVSSVFSIEKTTNLIIKVGVEGSYTKYNSNDNYTNPDFEVLNSGNFYVPAIWSGSISFELKYGDSIAQEGKDYEIVTACNIDYNDSTPEYAYGNFAIKILNFDKNYTLTYTMIFGL